MLPESGESDATIVKNPASRFLTVTMAMTMKLSSTPQLQAGTVFLQRRTSMPGRCKILIRNSRRRLPPSQEALTYGTRTRLIKPRRSQSLQRCRRSPRREEEKLRKTSRVAMAEQATPPPNAHYRRKSRRRSRRNTESAERSQKEPEKFRIASHSAMAKQATLTLNGYFCQKLQTRRWCKLTRVRLNALNAIISPRYL